MRLARLLIVAALAAACSSSQEEAPERSPRRGSNPLRDKLEFMVEGQAAQIEALCARQVAEGDTATSRRRGQLWKMTVIPELRTSLDRADEEAALLHLWARNAQMVNYFQKGAGVELFGARAEEGRDVFQQAVTRLDATAERQLGPERYPAAQELVRLYAEGNPLEVDPLGGDEGDSELNALLRDSLGKPLDVVMQPLRAINPGKGLDDTARAVQEFTVVVDDVRRDLNRIPEQTRWQSELLLLDLDESRSRAEAQQSLDAIRSSAEEISRTAQGLPADVEERVTTLLADLEQRQAELRLTLEAARGTLADGERVVQASEATARALTETAQAVDVALQSFAQVSTQLMGPPRPPDEPAPPPGEPFDIEDYTRTAEALTASLTQLNVALEQVGELTAPESSERLAQLVDEGVAAATRRLAWTAAGLVLLAAAAFGVARRWSSR